MKIRKEFRVESAHIVRNCTSHRCSHSIHGHSAVVEVFLESTLLDNAGMVYDFGLMKGSEESFRLLKICTQFVLDTFAESDFDKFNIAVYGKRKNY